MGLGGNVMEWEETEFDLVNGNGSSGRHTRGGTFQSEILHPRQALRSSFPNRFAVVPMIEHSAIGFRVANIPEPSTLLLVTLAGVGVLVFARRRQQ